MNDQIKEIAALIVKCVDMALVVFAIVTALIIWKSPIKPWDKDYVIKTYKKTKD